MFGHSTRGLAAQIFSVLEVLERRYCFSAAIAVQSASFTDPIPFEDELRVTGENTSNFIWGVDEKTGAGSGLKFDPTASQTGDDGLITIGNLVFHNIGTLGGEAAGVNLILTLKIDGKVQSITVPLGIDNTINIDDPIESRDSVFLDAGKIVGDVFEDAQGQRMAVVILGFRTGGDPTITDEFFSDEEADGSAQLVAAVLPENLLDMDLLRSSDVPSWQADRDASENDEFDDNSDSDDSSEDVIDDNGGDAWEDDLGDDAWDVDLGY
jgi:hypothetical protein